MQNAAAAADSAETEGAARYADRPVVPPEARPVPWVQLKYFSFAPAIYPAMIRDTSPGVPPGALVHVFDKDGRYFGQGLFNPKARVPLRVFHHGAEPAGDGALDALLDAALALRLDTLALPAQTEAFRVLHSDGDGLGGLVVDKFADVLSVEVHSLGMFQRLPAWLPKLHARLGTAKTWLECDPAIARMEGIRGAEKLTDAPPTVRFREHGVRYEANFAAGHKTGFFCDQRENRRRLAAFVKGRRVLDLCCYTGGFALAAKVLGGAAEVTGVDLDEQAVAQARRNANLNQARAEWVHVDAFSYARQMQRNGTTWDVVVLDPPKLIHGREEFEEGRRKYEDLNRLGVSLLARGGLLVTCSCSGLIGAEAFEETVVRAVHRSGRRLQILDRTGPGPDHPEMSNCPEGRYLKVIWGRLF